MKAVLKFNLPDEKEEFDDAVRGGVYRAALSDMENWLRSKIKYDDTLDEKTRSAFEASRDALFEIYDGWDIEI
jgi:hypothetical protein